MTLIRIDRCIIRRLLIASLILFVLTVNLNAQNSYGVKGGAIISRFQNTDYDAFTGLTIGVLKEYDIGQNISIQLELDYSERGADLGQVTATGLYSDGVYLYEVDIKLGYLELPFLIKYNIPLNTDFRLSPYGGLSIGFPFVNQSTVNRLYYVGHVDSVDYDYFLVDEGGGGEIDVAINFGIIGIYDGHYMIDIRYYHSFKNPGTIHSFPIEYKFQSFKFTLGYLF